MKTLIFNRSLLYLFMSTFFLFYSCSSDDGGSDDIPIVDNGDPFTSVVTDDSLLLDGNAFSISQLTATFDQNSGKTFATFALLNEPDDSTKNILNIALQYDENEPLDGTYKLLSTDTPANTTKEVLSNTNLGEFIGTDATTYRAEEAQIEVKHLGNKNYTLTLSIKVKNNNSQGSETPVIKTFTGTVSGKYIKSR